MAGDLCACAHPNEKGLCMKPTLLVPRGKAHTADPATTHLCCGHGSCFVPWLGSWEGALRT